MTRNCLLVLLTVLACDGYKFLVYSPLFGYSHSNYMGAIADALTEAGHNVTLLAPILDVEQENKTAVRLTKNVIKIAMDSRVADMAEAQKQIIKDAWVSQPSIYNLLQMGKKLSLGFSHQCERILQEELLIKQLEEEHFDVGIAEAFTICGFGIFEVIKTKTTIATFSGVYMDFIGETIGEPNLPSYVPGVVSTTGDRMNFVDRFKNTLETLFGRLFFTNTYKQEIAVFREKYGNEFKDWQELIAKISYMLTNGNPYVDFPRPTIHKTIQIGGITVPIDSKRDPLPAKWDAIMNKRSTNILISFGSIAKAVYMPKIYMSSLLEVFKSMPNTTFIMKYEEEDSQLVPHLPNLHLSTWLPQNDLLADSRLTAFVTHGGLGSTIELAHQGKPAILIPLFADQSRNAHMLAKHGGGIILSKNDLSSPNKLRDSLTKIIGDASYKENAERLSEMLLNQPISAKQLLVQHSEFAARFGRLPNLDPYGRNLSFIQYHLLDIMLTVLAIFLAVAYFSAKLLARCLRLTVLKSKIE